MYKTILVTLEVTPTDRVIIEHIKQLAKHTQGSVVLLHVATGIPAQWHGPDAGGEEVEGDRSYLAGVKAEFEAAGVPAIAELAYGDPVKEIVKWVTQRGCDLVAMSTHGHQGLSDLIHGSVASKVQHNVSVPVLLLRAK